MANVRVQGVTEAVETVLSYYTTPAQGITLAVNAVRNNASYGDTAVAAIGVAHGFVSTFGKSNPALALSLSYNGMDGDFRKIHSSLSDNGHVRTRDLLNAASNILGTISAVGGLAVVAGVAAPLGVGALVGLAVASASFAVFAAYSDSSFDVGGGSIRRQIGVLFLAYRPSGRRFRVSDLQCQ